VASTSTLHATAACTLLGRSTKTGSNTSSSGSAASTGTLRARRCCAAARTLLRPSTETGSNTSSSGSAASYYRHIARCCCLHAARGPSTKTGSIVPPARPALLPPQAHSYCITSLLRARSARAIDRDWFQRQLVRFCGLHRQLHAASACTLLGPSTETGSNTSSSGSAASTGTLRDRRCCCSHAA
jgi:hypothetical protein